MKKEKSTNVYNIGLDIGTSSVGYSVTDLDGNLIKIKNKNFWGVRLFEEGMTAAKRRTFRTTRRRIARRRFRINMLQYLLADEVFKVDSNFFFKLKDSYKHNTERENKYNLFNEIGLTDKDYYEEYPTIYHLRYDLINSNKQEDIRLIYLALHHIIKYRGNFLYEGMNLMESTTDVVDDFYTFFEYINEITNLDIYISKDEIVEYLSKLNNSNISRIEKLKTVVQSGKDAETTRVYREITKAILGNQFDFNRILMDELSNGRTVISYSKDHDEEDVISNLDGYEEIYYKLLKVYNYLILNKITGDYNYISESMINKFEKHKADLIILKRFIKNNYNESYNEIFREKDTKKTNYYNYLNNPNKHSDDDFYKYITNIISQNKDSLVNDDDYNYIVANINEKNFLQPLKVRQNSVIPYQLHLKELEEIINKQSKYYPGLLTNKDKIKSLVEFRIPYYVGPLNTKSNFGWVIKNNDQSIFPWNFSDVVNLEQTAEKFIRRMTNKCTYLVNEDVIPKNSLVNCEFELLNELNKVRINDKLISASLKKQLINDLFKKSKTVTHKGLTSYYKVNLGIDNITITGTQKKDQFASSLAPFIDFTSIFGVVDETNFEMIENIIYWITIFNDKEILRRKIQSSYQEINDSQLEQILKKDYKGWSSLSRKLIDGIQTDSKSGKKRTILDVMRNTNNNFMQIINSNKFSFNEQIKEYNIDSFDSKITIDEVNKFIVSPSLRKGVWQSIGIINEIIKIMKDEPANIFIEVTRSHQKRIRTESRIDKLIDLYKSIKDDKSYFDNDTFKELTNLKSKNNKLDDEKLFLYFIQNGRSMYSNTRLSLDKLHLYDVDHIIPRALIKDDSIENKVLVLSEENKEKNDSLVLDVNVRNSQEGYWRFLESKGLIGKKKLYNLLRSEFNESDIEGFIARQYVETSQIIKNVATIFSQFYQQTEIRLVKSQLVSTLRNNLKLYKVRNLNDYHHAHDAYLTSMIGGFTKSVLGFYKYDGYTTASKRKFKFRHSAGWVIDMFKESAYDLDSGLVIWNGEENISLIKKTLSYKDCFISKKAEEQVGEFYDQTIYPKSNKLKPLKKNMDPELYGGYKGIKEAYSVIVEYKKKDKKFIELVSVSVEDSMLVGENEIKLREFLEKSLMVENLIIKKKVRKHQFAIVNDHPVYITSTTEMVNAQQLLVDNKYMEFLYRLERNIIEENEKNEKIAYDLITHIVEKIRTYFPLYIKIADSLESALPKFKNLSFEKKCKFINEVLKITSPSASRGDFTEYGLDGLKSAEGRLRRKINIQDSIFIDKSITGVFDTKVKYGV